LFFFFFNRKLWREEAETEKLDNLAREELQRHEATLKSSVSKVRIFLFFKKKIK